MWYIFYITIVSRILVRLLLQIQYSYDSRTRSKQKNGYFMVFKFIDIVVQKQCVQNNYYQ